MIMQLLQDRSDLRSKANPSLPRVAFMTSNFYVKLHHEGYDSVRTWTSKRRKLDVFELDKLILPVNIMNLHWCLAVVYIQKRQLQYLDSLGGRGTTCLNKLKDWVEDEHLYEKGTELTCQWTTITDQTIPRQDNGHDCGVFACMFAEYLSEDLPLEFSQSNIPHFRRRLGHLLLEGKIP